MQFAELFGWTPREVDEVPAWLFDWLIPVLNVMREVQDEQQREPTAGDGAAG
ncbi:hypothetical protein [Actinomadura hibisca]|uniref:hypothetical protein n=1 Tax=Actinomadura hibisca TaxID=68565 RepID=UPI0012FAD9F5|nr:hypothetical protein [Actinomadura hibisca]